MGTFRPLGLQTLACHVQSGRDTGRQEIEVLDVTLRPQYRLYRGCGVAETEMLSGVTTLESARSIDSMDSRSTRWFASDQNGSGTSVTTSNGSLRRMTNWRRKRRTALDMSSPAFSKRDSASCRRRLSTRICSVDVAILQSFVVQNDCIVPESHLHVNEEK